MLKETNKIQISDLQCGGKLLHISEHHFSFEIVSVWLRAGSRFDPIGKEGLAHLFEHLFMTKTNKYRSQQDRNIALESDGIYFNAFTNKEIVYYHQSQLADKTQKSLGILLEGVSNSIINKDSLDSEKQVILDESVRNKDNVDDYIWDLSFSGLFKESRLAADFYGSKDSLKSITLEDIEDFRKKYYIPKNFYFVVISNLGHKLLVDQINTHFDNISSNGEINFEQDNISDKDLIKIEYREIENIKVALNYRLLDFSPDECATLDFLASYLGNTWISKLVTKLRLENKWTYWVEAYSFYLYEVGYFSLIFSLKSEYLNQSLELILQEIDRLRLGDMKDSDLDIYKTSYKSSLLRKLSDPYELLFWYGHNFSLEKGNIKLRDYLDKMGKLKSEDIKNVANKFLTRENLSLSLMGKINKEDIEI